MTFDTKTGERRMIRPPFAAAVVAAAIAATMSARAQTPAGSYLEIGVDPAAVVTRPLGSLPSVRGALPCSESYDGTTRVNPGVAAWVAWVLDNTRGALGELALRSVRLSAGIDDLSSDWVAPAQRYDAYDDVAGRYTSVETQFTTDFRLGAVRAALELEASLGGSLSMRFGPSLSLPTSASSTQRESILSPSVARFVDGTQERTIPEATGTIDDAGVRVGIGAAITYRLPLGRRLFFEPAIAGDLGLTSMQPEWTPLELRLGIGVGWALFADPEPVVVAPPTTPPVRPTPPEPFAATVSVSLASPSPIELRRQIIARYTPVIPVVFFDRDASVLPARYHRIDGASTEGFTEAAIAASADAAHLDVLNVLGARLLAARAAVTLTGTTSDDESRRDTLARARAEAVAEYLSSVWSIPRSRITVRSRLEPAVPTSGATEDGRAENRRVEITVADDALLAPVQQRTVEPVVEPGAIAFVASVDANKPVRAWSLAIGGPAGRTISGEGAVPERITWELTQEERERLLDGGSAEYRMQIEAATGEQAVSAPGVIPLRLDTTVTVATSATRPDNAAEFLLITFEFDQARLTERGRREIETIAGRVAESSRVAVTGYTDRIGEATHNLALARERAERVAALLPKAAAMTVRGADPDEAPYSNETPEGRFLSRTVRVVIESPR